MKSLSHYQKIADLLIKQNDIKSKPMDRVSQSTKDFMLEDYYIDVHTHFFDMKCINTTYFVTRAVADLIGIRGGEEMDQEEFIDLAYTKADVYTDNWNERLGAQLDLDRGGIRGILFKLLWQRKMEGVYKYYLDDSSLAKYFNLDKSRVLTTALMMDFKMGWNVDVGKTIYDQIDELKRLSLNKPVLPFFFVDPRRADLSSSFENLYSLFNYAFKGDVPFFGVKVYPCLGYNPSDYRLWPIYELCEKFSIPVLSHCGGTSVVTRTTEITTYKGEKEEDLSAYTSRKALGDYLNDPAHWRVVLERYKNLKLNIAHFGSSGTWSSVNKADSAKDPQGRKETIIDLMDKYDHVYSDFSYTITDEKATSNFVAKLKNSQILKDRSMFGSDYWVVSKEGQLRDNQRKFLDTVGDEDLKVKLCKSNPFRYLFL